MYNIIYIFNIYNIIHNYYVCTIAIYSYQKHTYYMHQLISCVKLRMCIYIMHALHALLTDSWAGELKVYTSFT